MFATEAYRSNTDMTFQDYEEKLQEQFARPIFYDETMVNLVHKVLGFPKEEVEYGFSGKLPELYTREKDGSFNINWKNVTDIYGRTDRESTKIDELEKFFRGVNTSETSIAEEADETVEIDWQDWQKRVGTKTAGELKQQLQDVFERTKPDLDLKRVEQTFDKNLQPTLDFVKDELFERLPLIVEFTNDVVRDSPLLKTDEFGNPLVNFDSPAFMDEYYPKERDEMILEIEDDIWDIQYLAEKKKLRMGPDELSEINQEWIIAESLKLEDAAAIQIEGGSGLSPQKREEEMIFKEVMEYGRKNKILEAEVSTLRLQREFEADDSAAKKAEEGGEKKEDLSATDASGFAEADFSSIVDALGGGSAADDMRDFKHMSKDEIKVWSQKDSEIRGEAEAELLRVQKGGK